MATTKSAIKRARQNEKVSVANTAKVSALRTAVKRVHQSIESGEGDTQELYNKAVKAIDSAATRGLIHKNKAARDKSRLSRTVAEATK